jgi:hypothetical protein
LAAAKREGDAGHELDAFVFHVGIGICGIVVDIAQAKPIASFHENGVVACREANAGAEV